MNTSNPAPTIRGMRRMIVLLPIGSCEQHGPYLPIDTDLRIAQLLAERLYQALVGTESLLLPALPFSASWEHRGLGTLALNVGTIAAVLHDLAYSLTTWHMPLLLVLVNWHGGNDLLASLATEITAREGVPTAVVPSIAQVGKAWDESRITSAKDIHAGAVETSVIRAYWPDLVFERLPASAHDEPVIAPAKVQAVLQALGSYALTREGIWGAPEQADPDKGRALIETLVQSMADQILALRDLVDKQPIGGGMS